MALTVVTGIGITSRVNELSPRAKVSYPAYNKFSADISDSEYLYCLLKPIDESKMDRALLKAVDRIEHENTRCIWIRFKGELRSVPVNEVSHIESRGAPRFIPHCGRRGI